MSNKPRVIWLAPICMLLLSTLHWPYGYYTLLRIVVTGSAGYLTYLEYSRANSLSPFVVLMTFLTILFNPIIPIYFPKSVWTGLDIVAALLLSAHGVIFHIRNNFLNK